MGHSTNNGGLTPKANQAQPNASQGAKGSDPHWLVRQRTNPAKLLPVVGFEQTDYAWCGDHIVWVGDNGAVRHPRNYWNPWQAPDKSYSAALMQAGARLCLKQITANKANQKSLLLWLLNQPMAFPMDKAAQRFDAIRTTLQSKDTLAFEAATLRVLGLGQGLTPSGDDFLGGLFFAFIHLNAAQPALQAKLLAACKEATNPISAALLSDSMNGASYGELHDLLDALESNDSAFIEAATNNLLRLGASSGADLLAGLLLALTLN